ncbi:MAG: hypothetical protein JKY11_05130 [Alphaproteobacteria bacterium]|nr:hypothetical protein [Alphaproteobacteria bacterium]
MKALLKYTSWYLIISSIAVHIIVSGILILKPEFSKKAFNYAINYLSPFVPTVFAGASIKPKDTLDVEIANQFGNWIPQNTRNIPKKVIKIGSKTYASFKQASPHIKDGDTVIIGPGTYHEPFIIKANYVKIIGAGHVIIENTQAEGKGAILTKGDFTSISNIECRNITVADNNGACVRHEGSHLELNHVYFHDSQSGLLAGKHAGLVAINNSRFEKLGKNGQAHGVYTNGGELYITNSLFIAAQSEGHEIKSRSRITVIKNSVIASLSSIDSRLIDVSQGGILSIKNSILQQGPFTANGDMIGFGLEGMPYPKNSIELSGNTFILERNGHNVLIHKKLESTLLTSKNNLIIAKEDIQLPGFNLFHETREDAGFKPYPFIPKL